MDVREQRDLREKSVLWLISTLFREISTLLDRQIALSKLEASSAAEEAARALGVVTAGGIVAVVGFIYLALALVSLLARVIPEWAAAGAVGPALTAIGAAALGSGLTALRSLRAAPRVTAETLKEDREWIKQQIRSSGR